MKRRAFIKNGIMGTIGIGFMPGYTTSSRDCTKTLSDMLGPYWSPNHPERTVLANLEEPGDRIFISGVVTADDCGTPIQNASVDVWHANDEGCYTVFQGCESGNSSNDPYNLRGIIFTDQNGYYGFESILPGYYAGRPRHFHYKITSPSGLELVTQCYFEVDPLTNGEWEENYPDLVIPLEETENGLVGVFDIIMNEEASSVKVDNKHSISPNSFTLDTVYPNPFNDSINIHFTINNFGYVDIGVYDLRYKWIVNLIGKQMHSGNYNIIWRGEDVTGNAVASGPYRIVMKFGSSIQTKKINYIK